MYRLASDLAAPARLTSAGSQLLCMASVSGPYMPALYTVSKDHEWLSLTRAQPRSSSTGIRVRHRTLLLKRDMYIYIHILDQSLYQTYHLISQVAQYSRFQIGLRLGRTRINDTSTTR